MLTEKQLNKTRSVKADKECAQCEGEMRRAEGYIVSHVQLQGDKGIVATRWDPGRMNNVAGYYACVGSAASEWKCAMAVGEVALSIAYSA